MFMLCLPNGLLLGCATHYCCCVWFCLCLVFFFFLKSHTWLLVLFFVVTEATGEKKKQKKINKTKISKPYMCWQIDPHTILCVLSLCFCIATYVLFSFCIDLFSFFLFLSIMCILFVKNNALTT